MFEKKWKFWAFVVGVWVLLGTLSSINLYFIEARDGSSINWFTAFIWGMPDMLVWAIFTPIIALILNRFPLEQGVWPKSLAILIAISLIIPLLNGVIDAFFNGTVYWLYGYDFSFGHSIRDHLTFEYFQHVIICWLVISFFTGLRYYERYRERTLRAAKLEFQLSQAQLHSLRMQLNPHFLFNTLNTVSALVEEQPRLARRVLASLGDLLRSSLDQNQNLFVTLEKELEFTKRYLEIESVRLSDRLSLKFGVAPETEDALVPNLILQPLVENAIHHGIAPKVAPGMLKIESRIANGTLELVVQDNGMGLQTPNGPVPHEGVGLRNTRERLEKIYGGEARFDLHRTRSGWTEALIQIPTHLTNDISEKSGMGTHEHA